MLDSFFLKFEIQLANHTVINTISIDVVIVITKCTVGRKVTVAVIAYVSVRWKSHLPPQMKPHVFADYRTHQHAVTVQTADWGNGEWFPGVVQPPVCVLGLSQVLKIWFS